MSRKPPVPKGVGSNARALWRSVTGTFTLDPNEVALLREVVRIVDRLETLEEEIAREGVMVDGGPKGPASVPNPALVEARQQQIVLGRLMTTLRLPEDWTSGVRPQRRGAARGPYGPRSMAAVG